MEPEALISYAGYGGPNRNSDPTIGASVNALARLGVPVTLRNPVGLYMDHIDLSGWQTPDGKDAAEPWHLMTYEFHLKPGGGNAPKPMAARASEPV